MFVTSLKLSALVLVIVPVLMVPLIGFGRWIRTLSRKSQDTHRRYQRPRRRNHQCRADGAVLHP